MSEYDEHPGWSGLYILDEHDNPVPCYDTPTWGRWIEAASRDGRKRVCADYDEGDATRQIFVSTVFLGVDHGFGSGPPILYETMVFMLTAATKDKPGERISLDDLTRRYHTRDEAMRGHQEVCQIVAKTIKVAAKEEPHG